MSLSSLSVPDRTSARRGLAMFVVLAFAFNFALTATMVITGNLLWMYALMWSVALASVITRLVRREGFGDVCFRFGGRRSWRWIAFGWVYPLVLGFIVFGFAWVTGLAGFGPTAHGLTAQLVGPDTAPLLVFLVGVLLAATVGTLFGLLSAAGEEIGWRGYMLPRLIDAGVPRPVLVHGLIWAAWHQPMIAAGLIYGEHPVRVVAMIMFAIAATAFGFVLARARLDTGSIWPGTVAHSAWNSIIQAGFYPAVTGGTAAMWWVDMETGVLMVAALIVGAVLVWRGDWVRRRTPDQPMVQESVPA